MWRVKVQVGGAMPRGQDWREGRRQIKVWRAAYRGSKYHEHCQDNGLGKPADNLSHAHHEDNRQGHAPVDVGTESGGLTGRARQQASQWPQAKRSDALAEEVTNRPWTAPTTPPARACQT